MKNRLFSIVLVLSIIFLAILWSREQTYRARLSRINLVLTALETRTHLLKLKAEALKTEVELTLLLVHVKLLKGQGK